MRLIHLRPKTAGLAAVLAAAGALAPAAPATAGPECGPRGIPCPTIVVEAVRAALPVLPVDVFGDIAGWTCGGTFFNEGKEGSRFYFSGPIEGATYVHSDVQTKSISVTCAVRDADTVGSGTVRGSQTANSVAPLNNVVSATGAELTYWKNDPPVERLWLCTTVSWVDRAGLSHSSSYDVDRDRAGAQCPEMVPLVQQVA